MRSLHVISSLMPEGGGPSYTVPRLTEALAATGWEAQIAALETPAASTKRGVPISDFGRNTVLIPSLAKLGRSRAMSQKLGELGSDVIHAHGLWMMPSIYAARVAKTTGQPFVLAPRGMLGADALRFSATAKRLFWAIWQQRAVAQVSCFHATAESELEDIRAFGLSAPVAIIPNGVDLPNRTYIAETTGAPFVLSLGRLHPKKGLECLISAFSRVAPEFPDWQLRIVGMDEGGHSDALRRAISVAGLQDRIHVEGPVFGEEKFDLMARASLFVLPSLHENFAVTVAESLAVETPVISSKGAPWRGLEVHGCGWWIDHGVEPLAASLSHSMALTPEARAAMGKLGREWMRCDFAWVGIGERTAQVYDWLLGRGPQPPFVFS